MSTCGKILFYNEQNGSGIFMTKDNQKIKFNIDEWNDYENMPSLGLEISCVLENGIASKIDVLKQSEIQEKRGSEETKETQESTHVEKSVVPVKISSMECNNKNIKNISEEINALLSDSGTSIDSLNSRISLSQDITSTMHAYFEHLQESLSKREGYKKVNGRLNYLLAKRFLWTTFNNLLDIDTHILTIRISSVSDDLHFVSNLKDDFDKKIRYPLSAFQDIFLASQSEYALVKGMTLEIIERLTFLRNKEEIISFEKKKKKKEILKAHDKEDKIKLTRELKIYNGTYADIVHMMAKLQEIQEKNTKRLTDFENSYKEGFYKTFQAEAKKHKKNIVDILNAQAYLLDSLLWQEAKTSSEILSYFHSLSIDIELNTKTYLKYYLNTLDGGKSNKETRDLFAFYDHLVEIQKDYILIITSSAQDALEYSQYIKSSDKSLIVKSFISELESIKWAMTNSVKVIILDATLVSTSAKKYLDYYHNNIFSKPKIILIGQANIKSNNYTIDRVVPATVQPQILVKTLKEVINLK
jgi:hypothetical protein